MQLLQSLRESNPYPGDINIIIESVYKIAVTYLCMHYKKIHKLIIKEGLSVEDVAIDSIAPLFLKNEEGYFYVLKDTFEQWTPAPQTDDDVLYILNKVTAKRIEQHIVLLLKEADPFFSKILDSVYYLMKKNGFKKKNYLGLSYIVDENTNQIIGETIDEAAFTNLPLELFTNKKELLNNIFCYLKTETGYFPAIPVNILTRRLEAMSANDYAAVNESQHYKEAYDVDELLKRSFKQTENKLNDTYVSKGKLSYREAEFIKEALMDICEDLKQGGINSSLFEYLQLHKENLTKDEYMKNYNHILQYLFKVMKSTISQHLNP